jgi:serine/threonine-protein kinase
MQPSTAATDAALARALTGSPYRYVGFIGSGGMATVVEAEHLGLAKRVVVKLLREELCARPDLVDRMRVEAQALARLSHPNLVQVFDFGVTEGGRAYVAMERLIGRTLAQELSARGCLPAGECLELFAPVLRALAVAHDAGIVHRDIKPHNLFVCDGPPRHVKVLDFGIAKVVNDAELDGMLPPRFATREGVSIGTPHYGAPEQLRGGVVSPATDVYALGIVLYECLAGRHPFAEFRTRAELQQAQLVSMPRPPSEVASQPLGRDLDRLVMRAIAKAPSDRFPDGARFAGEIELFLSGKAPVVTDLRDVPTLQSHERPVVGSVAPTLRAVTPPAPTLISGPVPTPIAPLAIDVAPPTENAPLSLGATLPEGHAPPASSKGGEVLGALCLVAGFGNLVWHSANVLMQLTQLIDPLAIITSARGVPPADVASDVLLFLRLAASAEILRNVLLAMVGATLSWVGFGLVRKKSKAFARAKTWSTWGFVVVAVGLLIELAVVMPLQARAYSLVPVPSSSDVLEGVGLGLMVLIVIAVPTLQAVFIAVIRTSASKLSRPLQARAGR